MYINPPLYLRPGAIVEHVSLPGVQLEIVSGPQQGATGDILYWVKLDNKAAKVKRKNLIT